LLLELSFAAIFAGMLSFGFKASTIFYMIVGTLTLVGALVCMATNSHSSVVGQKQYQDTPDDFLKWINQSRKQDEQAYRARRIL